MFPSYLMWEKLVPSYFETDKHCCSYLEREKSGSLVQEDEKNVSQLFGSAKNWFLAIQSLTNTVAAICREKKVDPCYLETKKCSSQLLGAKKKIKTSI